LAIDFLIVHGCVAGILVGHTLRSGIKFFFILLGPPVAQVALGIELAALVVEAVSQFMSDYGANPTEVQSIISTVIVERRLENSRWKGDVVELRVVTSIHGHGWVRPVVFVDRLANLVQLALKFELIRT